MNYKQIPAGMARGTLSFRGISSGQFQSFKRDEVQGVGHFVADLEDAR